LEILAYKKDGSVFFEVSDTGVGIKKQDLSNIFEPFYSTKKNNKKLTGGSGLGLCFCRDIVEKAGGSITVESEVGSGTKFKIQLPQIPDVGI
jgi:two-component system, OmpR family, sensor kinase